MTFSSGLKTEVSHVVQVRAEGPKAHSPGQWTQAARPVGAELTKVQQFYKKL